MLNTDERSVDGPLDKAQLGGTATDDFVLQTKALPGVLILMQFFNRHCGRIF